MTENSKNCVYVWLTFIIKLYFLQDILLQPFHLCLNWQFAYNKTSSGNQIFDLGYCSVFLHMHLAEMCAKDWYFSQLKTNFRQNYWLRFFIQCLSPHVFTCILPIDSPLLCLVPGNGYSKRGKSQEVHICLNHLDKRIDFFQNNHLDFSHHGLNQQSSNYKISFNVIVNRREVPVNESP